MQQVFQEILDTAATRLASESNVQELENTDNHGFHVVLRRRTPWFCMTTAVLKVLGAITPRMYAGSRIRIHEFLMDGENDVSTLIHAAYQSHGTGTIIKYHRSMGEALVLMDKLDTPKLVNCYVFDVVDRIGDTGVLGDGLVGEVDLAVLVERDVLQQRVALDGVVDVGLGVLVEVDDLGVAAAFEVKHTVIIPAVGAVQHATYRYRREQAHENATIHCSIYAAFKRAMLCRIAGGCRSFVPLRYS